MHTVKTCHWSLVLQYCTFSSTTMSIRSLNKPVLALIKSQLYIFKKNCNKSFILCPFFSYFLGSLAFIKDSIKIVEVQHNYKFYFFKLSFMKLCKILIRQKSIKKNECLKNGKIRRLRATTLHILRIMKRVASNF